MKYRWLKLFLFCFLILSLISILVFQPFRFSTHQVKTEEGYLNTYPFSEKKFYTSSDDLILTFIILSWSRYDETYLLTLDRQRKIAGWMGRRTVYDEIDNNYLKDIEKSNEKLLTISQLNNLTNLLDKLDEANLEKLAGAGGHTITIFYNNKKYITSRLEDPIIDELFHF